MFPDDGGVADLAVAETQLEMREADRARVVGAFRRMQRFGQEGDAAGRLAAGGGQASVHAPQVREPRRIEPFARFWRSPQCFSGLTDVILEQPRIGERAPHLDLFVALDSAAFERADEQRRSIRAAPLFERLQGLTEVIGCRHGRQYTKYPVRNCSAD
jgi:hypothetical protein